MKQAGRRRRWLRRRQHAVAAASQADALQPVQRLSIGIPLRRHALHRQLHRPSRTVSASLHSGRWTPIRIRKKTAPPPPTSWTCAVVAVAMEAVAWSRPSRCSFSSLPKSPPLPPLRAPPASTVGRRRRRPCLVVIGGEKVEIRVCVNRSCNRMGSREILAVLADIAPPEVSVNSCGCLGRCGAGPNLVVLPEGTLVGHCGTPARAAELLAVVCGGVRGGAEGSFDPWKNLEALALRKKGEVQLVEIGNPAEAEALLSQAIDLRPSGGLHAIYKSRSVARLKLRNSISALEDANEALRIAPNFPQAYICQGDAFMAMGELSKAEKAYSEALLIDPSIRRSKSFKERVAKLQEKVVEANISN